MQFLVVSRIVFVDVLGECLEPKFYTPCLCQRTCPDHLNATFTCLDVGDAACQPGCQCPDGYVIHNGECIPPQNCSEMCLYNGVVYDVRGVTCIDCFVKFRFVIKCCLIV